MKEVLEEDGVSYRQDGWDRPDFTRTLSRRSRSPGRTATSGSRSFTRGGNAGTIIVGRGDGKAIAKRLIDGGA